MRLLPFLDSQPSFLSVLKGRPRREAFVDLCIEWHHHEILDQDRGRFLAGLSPVVVSRSHVTIQMPTLKIRTDEGAVREFNVTDTRSNDSASWVINRGFLRVIVPDPP